MRSRIFAGWKRHKFRRRPHRLGDNEEKETIELTDITVAWATGTGIEKVIAKQTADTSPLRRLIGRGPEAFYREIFGNKFWDCLDSAETDDRHHTEAIHWHWDSRMNLLLGKQPEYYAYFPIFARGNLKSSLAEIFVATDALLSVAYGQPGFCLYLGREKHRVKENIANIETILSRPKIRQYAPALSECAKNEETNSKRQWTGSFLHTAANYVIKGGTVESSQAGSRIAHLTESGADERRDTRPTCFILDDIDSREDSPVIAETRFKLLTTEILPMRQDNSLTFFAQNLISRYSTMYRIQQGGARVLTNRKPTVPIPAVRDPVFETRTVNGIVKDVIVSGRPTWRVWTLERVQNEIDTMGLPAFNRECQHLVEDDREGRILSNYDDAIHTISESEFAWKYGARDAWLTWPKRAGNDWAATKTDKHANVAGWLTRAPQNTALPNVEFFFPLSFAADTSPEDVAERLLSQLSEHAYGETTWRELRLATIRRADATAHTATDAERIAYERGAVAQVIPKYTRDLLRRCRVQQGAISHERKTIREMYSAVYGLPFRAVNPGKFGAIETINGQLRVDYDQPHAFRELRNGYTAWYLVAPDDKSAEPERRTTVHGDEIDVYPPIPYPTEYRTDDMHDAQLCRFQMRSCRYSAPKLTATGEAIGNPLKLYDDFFNLYQMLYSTGGIGDTPLTHEEQLAVIIPAEVQRNLVVAEGADAKLNAILDYNFQRNLAEQTLRPPDYTGFEDWD